MKHNLIKKKAGGIYVINPDTGLTPQQEKCALMMASGFNISEVSKKLNIGRGTLYRWLGLMPFQCYLNLMKQDAKNYMENCLMGLQIKAIETIKASLDSDTEALRLRSAMWIVDKIGQMEVGATDARQVLKKDCMTKNGALKFNYSWESDYKQMLQDAGLSE